MTYSEIGLTMDFRTANQQAIYTWNPDNVCSFQNSRLPHTFRPDLFMKPYSSIQLEIRLLQPKCKLVLGIHLTRLLRFYHRIRLDPISKAIVTSKRPPAQLVKAIQSSLLSKKCLPLKRVASVLGPPCFPLVEIPTRPAFACEVFLCKPAGPKST